MDNEFPYYEDNGYYEGPSDFGDFLLKVLVFIGLVIVVGQFLD
jgi:hypothetical protein